MKRLILLTTLLLGFPLFANAQTATVTGSVKYPTGGNPTRASVCFTLDKYKPNVPRVSGSAVVINQTNFCVNADSSGDISTTLYRNDFITPTGTEWIVDYKYNNLLQSRASYSVITATFDLDTATPISSAPAAATTSVIAQGYVHVQVAAATTWTINHNFSNQNALCLFYDSSNQMIWPDTFVLTSSTVATATFTVAQAGRASCVVAGTFSLISSSLAGALLTTPTSDQAAAGNFNLAVGGNFQWDSSTAFRATFDHANTATRTYTFPNATGTVPLLGNAQTWTAIQTHSANILPDNNTRSLGNSSAAWDATLDDVVAGKVNNILYVDGVKYPFTAAGLQSCINDATPNKICDASAMPSFTSAVQITVGNASSEAVTLILPNGPTWSFSITDGTSCGIKQFNKSIIKSQASVSNGLQMSLQPSGASTSMRALYCTDRTQTDGYYYAEGFLARNTVGASFTHGLIEITHAADNSVFRNISAINSSGVGLKIYEVCCGTSFYNLTSDGLSGAGAKPVRIGDSTLGAFTIGGGAINVGFYGLSATHPGNNEYAIELGDSTNTSTRNANVEGVQFYNIYMEPHSSNTTTAGMKIWDDVHNIGVYGASWTNNAGGATAYVIDLDSWAGPSNSTFLNVKSQTLNAINDNITGRAITGAANYGQAVPYISGGANIAGTIDANRYKAKGTALVAGDFALHANWGAGAAIGTITGTDQAWVGTVTAAGVPGASPTLILTFKNGTWTDAPLCISKMTGGTGTITDLSDSTSATAHTITFNGTPVAASTYIITSICMGR